MTTTMEDWTGSYYVLRTNYFSNTLVQSNNSPREFIQAERKSSCAILMLLNFELKGMEISCHRRDTRVDL